MCSEYTLASEPSTPDRPILASRHLSGGYHGVCVFQDLSLQVLPGEFVALAGRNGAGKTTLLRTLVSQLPPMAGHLLVDGTSGKPLAGHRLARRGIAYVSDRRNVFRDMTVRENLALFHQGNSSPPDYENELLAVFPELRDRLRIRAGLLSGGEQGMLAMMCSLLGQPRLLIVDEFSQGLQLLVIERLTAYLRQLQQVRHLAMLFVEQSPDIMLTLADRGYVMKEGSIALQGDRSYLRDNWRLIMELLGL